MKNLIYTNTNESSKLKRFFSFIFLKEISKTKRELQFVRVPRGFTKTLAILIAVSLIHSKAHAVSLTETTAEIRIIGYPCLYSDEEETLISDIELSASLLEVEQEAPLEIENWMLDQDMFTPHLESFELEVETEPALELEDWMLQHDYFNVPTMETESEPKFDMENWILSHQN